jgi:hypothetical protein
MGTFFEFIELNQPSSLHTAIIMPLFSDQALQTYQTALQYFSTYLKYEKNAKVREAILEKASIVPYTETTSFLLMLPHLPHGSPSFLFSSKSTSKGQNISREQWRGRTVTRMGPRAGQQHKRSRNQEPRARRM